MAKRSIKPPYNPLLKSCTESDKINAVSEGAEVLYYRLIAQCDDLGRYYGDPAWVLAKLFTARMAAGTLKAREVKERIAELAEIGLIRTYEHKGTQFIEVTEVFKTFRNDYEPQPLFPEPLNEADTNSTRTRDELDTTSDDFGVTEDKQQTTNNKQQKQKSTASSSLLAPPFSFPAGLSNDDGFEVAWLDWIRHRLEIKKPLKPTQAEKQIKMLAAKGAEAAIAMIEHTIEKGWQGLREPDTRGSPNGQHENDTPDLKALAAQLPNDK